MKLHVFAHVDVCILTMQIPLSRKLDNLEKFEKVVVFVVLFLLLWKIRVNREAPKKKNCMLKITGR